MSTIEAFYLLIGVAIGAVTMTVTYVRLVLKRRKPKHEHDWEFKRAMYYRIRWGIFGGQSDAGEAQTDAHWRCKTCGKLKVTEHVGFWKPEDFQ